MRKLIALFLLVISLFLTISSAAIADTSLDQNVPFGLTQSKDGQYIPVFDNIDSQNKTDLLLPDQLCALNDSILQGTRFWHYIIYLDEEGTPKAGYVKETNFKQFSLAEYTELLLNPEARELIEQYTALSKSSPLFQQVQTASSTTKTETQKRQYILNTNTRKFHYPNCKSVKQMKEKNKRSYTGTREEIIEMGYAPCKNCNP